jgi:hypothetical protein
MIFLLFVTETLSVLLFVTGILSVPRKNLLERNLTTESRRNIPAVVVEVVVGLLQANGARAPEVPEAPLLAKR